MMLAEVIKLHTSVAKIPTCNEKGKDFDMGMSTLKKKYAKI